MSVVTAIIKSEGIEISGTYELLSIDVTNEFNKIPTAELRFIDGDIPKKEFKILDDTSFDLGKQITIALKYEEKTEEETKIFSGIVVNKVFELNGINPTLTVEISDVTIKMNSHRKNKVHAKVEDVQIYKSLLKQNGLEKGIIENTPVTHQQMIQYYTTDWDFMLSRAEANAQLVSIYNGKVSIFKPRLQKASGTLELGLGEIYDFELQISADQQYNSVQAFAWDITKNKLTQPTQGSGYKLSQKHIDIPKIAQTMGTEKAMLMTGVPTTSMELKLWSSAQVLKSRLSLIKGWVKIPGTGKIKVGDTLVIKDFSKTFSGKNVISAVRQEVTVDGWDTYLQIGMEACWFTASNKVMDTPAAGLLPGVNGLQIGVVQPTERDPDNLHRIKVTIPAFGEKQTVWARLTTLDAGANRGTFFIPQPNDEVIVGFLNDDPRHAIIMGSVYNPINKPPLPLDKHPKSKGIFTQSNFQLFLDEEKQCITIATSDKNRITIDEKQKRIELSDSHGNQVELNKKGIDILSAKDCKIMSKGDLKIEASGSVAIKGKTVDII
ncbi:type VI secretion system tip protein VgrG [Aquimarina mytili]|uniref:Type VI secretion system tip protein VgrG n=1 Tax=Aquimarina mytili TaxID=874423 RepID=A0A936ZX45_9FLAO|nr:type VI secretion system tip protein VgrG [Aquimarina mytili]MBL0683871.1 type VI secretion system tip protein VgrG [Aquimarina mytili]